MAPTCTWGAGPLQCDLTGAACISWPVKAQLKPFGPKLSHNQSKTVTQSVHTVQYKNLDFFFFEDCRFRTTRPDQTNWVRNHPWWCPRGRTTTVRISPAHQESSYLFFFFFMMRISCSRRFNLSQWQQQDHKWHDETVYLSKKKDLNFQKSCAHLKHGHEIQELCGGAWDHVAHPGLVFWESFIQGGINDSAGMSVTYFNCSFLFYDDPCADTSTKLRTSAQILHKLTIVVSKWKLCRSFWWDVENSEIITQMGFFVANCCQPTTAEWGSSNGKITKWIGNKVINKWKKKQQQQ